MDDLQATRDFDGPLPDSIVEEVVDQEYEAMKQENERGVEVVE